MGKIFLNLALSCALISLNIPAEAQQTKVIRIGVLRADSPSSHASEMHEAFRQGLHELGYIEGKNLFIEYRYAEGKPDRLPELAAELVRLKVDVFVTVSGGQPVRPSVPPARFPLWLGARVISLGGVLSPA